MQEQNKEFKYLTPKKIAQMAQCDSKLVRPYFEKFYLKRLTYMDKGEERPLIRLMRKENKFALLLKNTTTSLRAFYEQCVKMSAYFVLPVKQDGMLTPNEMRDKWGRTHDLYRDLVEDAYQEKIFFEENGIQKPLIIMVKNPYKPVLVLQASEKALNRFIEFTHEKGEHINFNIPPRREASMLSATNLHYRFGVAYDLLNQFFQKYYEEGKTFDVDGKSYPLVQKVRSEKIVLLTLHEHPNALLKFKTLFEQETDIPLGKRDVTTQETPILKKTQHPQNNLENEG